MDCILLDFSKAFDKLPHIRLLYKLKYYGVCGNTLNRISLFLQNRTQTGLVNGKTSRELDPGPIRRPAGHCVGAAAVSGIHQ